MKILFFCIRHRVCGVVRQGLRRNGHAVDLWPQACETAAGVGGGGHEMALLFMPSHGAAGVGQVQRVREQCGALPLIVLCNQASAAERAQGLDAGADDYMVAPFSLEELSARINSLHRRSTSGGAGGRREDVLQLGDLTLDRLKRRAVCGGRASVLTDKEFALLELFFSNPARPLNKRQIYEYVWASGAELQTNVVDVLVCRLREKLEAGQGKRVIRTVRGVGYALDVAPEAPAGAAG